MDWLFVCLFCIIIINPLLQSVCNGICFERFSRLLKHISWNYAKNYFEIQYTNPKLLTQFPKLPIFKSKSSSQNNSIWLKNQTLLSDMTHMLFESESETKENLHILTYIHNHDNDNRWNKWKWHKSIFKQKPARISFVKQSIINITQLS